MNPPTTCTAQGCSRPHWAKGFCDRHYQRFRKYGDATKLVHLPVPARCRIPDCNRPGRSRELCERHYYRLCRYGDPLGGPVRRVRGSGSLRKGYLRYSRNGHCVSAHREVWEAANGPIPPGYDVHHINGDKLDNRLDNFELLPHRTHSTVTRIADWKKRHAH